MSGRSWKETVVLFLLCCPVFDQFQPSISFYHDPLPCCGPKVMWSVSHQLKHSILLSSMWLANTERKKRGLKVGRVLKKENL